MTTTETPATETPCEQVPGESRDESRVIEQARKRAAELMAMAEDENWLGI